MFLIALGVLTISNLPAITEVPLPSQIKSSEPVLAAVSRNTSLDQVLAADQVNTTVTRDDFLIRLSANTSSLVSSLREKLDNQQLQLVNMVKTLNSQNVEMNVLKSELLKQQGTRSTDTGDKQMGQNFYLLERAVVEPYGSHFHCERGCRTHLSRFLCHTGCSIHKINVRLAVLNHRNMITPCVKAQGFDGRPAVRECFHQKLNLLLDEITAKFGLPGDLVPVNALGVPECESLSICKSIASPDRECEIVRLNAYIKFMFPSYITSCEKNSWSMVTAVHNCAMIKLDLLMDAVFS